MRKEAIMEKSTAFGIWEDVFGEKKWAQDCFGTWMYKSDYGDREKRRNNRPGGTGRYYQYGWEIDHIKPKSAFSNEADADFENNYEPMQWKNNMKKSDNYPLFTINNEEYEIIECSICKANGTNGYGIIKTSNNKRIDWKYMENAYYED